jgi:outer membrane receptor protein involved in Fe transport
VTGGVEADSFGYRQKLGLSGTVKDLGYSLRQGYTDGEGYRTNNYYRSENYHLGLSFQPPESAFGLEFRAGTNAEDYGLPGSLTRAQLDAGFDWNDTDDPYNYALRETHYVSATPKYFINDENALQLGLTYRERLSEANYRSPGFLYQADARDTQLGLAPQWTNTSELLGRANTFTLGMEHYESDKHNIRNTVEASRRTTDVFLTDTLELVDDVLFDVGYRHGRAEFEFADFADRGFDLDAYRAGLTWNYRPGSKLFASWDRSFRVGSLDEYIVYPDWPAAPFVNPNLLPQITETLQAGLKHRFGPRLTAGVTVFQIETKDEIFYDPNDGTFSAFFPGNNRNYDHTLRQGVTTELTSQVTDDWRVFANHTYTDSELGDDNGPENYHGRHIPMVPENTVNVGSELTFLEAFTWSAAARWRDHQYSASDWRNNLDMVSDYVVVDTKLSYTWEWLTLYAGVSNVFDEEYAEFVTRGVNYYPSPGRTYFAGVNVTYDF